MSSVRVNFPQDVSIDDEFIQYGNNKVSYNEVKSIAVYVKQSVTNLTYYTGIPTFKDLSSKVAILLSNGNRIEIQVAEYSEWGPFKNKKGLNLTSDALSFANFLESTVYDINKINKEEQISIKDVDINRYKDYKYSFLTSHNSEHTTMQDLFWNEINSD